MICGISERKSLVVSVNHITTESMLNNLISSKVFFLKASFDLSCCLLKAFSELYLSEVLVPSLFFLWYHYSYLSFPFRKLWYLSIRIDSGWNFNKKLLPSIDVICSVLLLNKLLSVTQFNSDIHGGTKVTIHLQ